MQIVTIGPQLTLLPNPCFTMLFNQTDTPKVPLPVGESTPREIHVPWIHPTQHTKLHFNQFDPSNSAHQTASRSILPFLHRLRQRIPILYYVCKRLKRD